MKPSTEDVRDTLRALQALDESGRAVLMDVRVDEVVWEPFCSRWSCSCAVPDGDVCEEWMGVLGEGHERRCPRCGWPEHRHDVRFRVTRLPRLPSEDDDPCPWRVQCSSSRCATSPWWVPTYASALTTAARHRDREHA